MTRENKKTVILNISPFHEGYQSIRLFNLKFTPKLNSGCLSKFF